MTRAKKGAAPGRTSCGMHCCEGCLQVRTTGAAECKVDIRARHAPRDHGVERRQVLGVEVFKKYSQMKLQMKREALEKINRQANEMQVLGAPSLCTAIVQ